MEGMPGLPRMGKRGEVAFISRLLSPTDTESVLWLFVSRLPRWIDHSFKVDVYGRLADALRGVTMLAGDTCRA
jgi:hypothetical protein